MRKPRYESATQVSEEILELARQVFEQTAGIESGFVRCLKIGQICKQQQLGIRVQEAAIYLCTRGKLCPPKLRAFAGIPHFLVVRQAHQSWDFNHSTTRMDGDLYFDLCSANQSRCSSPFCA